MSKRFVSDALIYLGANVANAAVPFALLPVLTRVLSPADYGFVAMFGTAVSILAAFAGLNVSSAISVRYFQLERERLPSYIYTCLSVLLLSTVAVVALVALGGARLAALVQLPLFWLLAAALAAGAQVATNMRLILWQAEGFPLRYGVLQVSQSLFNAGLSLFFVLALGMAWQGRLLGQTIVAIVFMTIALILLRQEIRGPARSADLKDALRFGVPLIPHVIGGLMIAATDRVLIANMLDISQVGLYTVGLQIGMVMSLLVESFNKVYAPWLMRALVTANAVRDAKIVRGTYVYFVVVTCIAVGLGLLAPLILSVLAGHQFRASASVIVYVALGYALSGMYYMVTNYIFFAGKTAHLAFITLASGLFNVLVTWHLIQVNGVVGAAQGFMLSQACLFAGSWWLAQRARPMPWWTGLWHRLPPGPNAT